MVDYNLSWRKHVSLTHLYSKGLLVYQSQRFFMLALPSLSIQFFETPGVHKRIHLTIVFDGALDLSLLAVAIWPWE